MKALIIQGGGMEYIHILYVKEYNFSKYTYMLTLKNTTRGMRHSDKMSL